MRRGRHSCFWAAWLVLASGCAEELGPERMETTRVTGVVLEGGRPIRKGWIEFVPFDGTVGRMRSAPIRPDGTFVAETVAVGVNRIGIAGAALTIPNGRRIFDPLGSKIVRTIPRQPAGPITIDLLVEYARLASDAPRAAH